MGDFFIGGLSSHIQRILKKDKYRYLLVLVLLGAILSFVYYSYLAGYLAESKKALGYEQFPLYGPHYYEHYLKSVVLWDSLQKPDLHAFFRYYFDTEENAISLFRSVPFFMVFGPSEFVYIYSNFFFNYLLFLLVYIASLNIFRPKESFVFSIFLISSFGALALFASPYVDLSLMMACSLFFMFLYLFRKDYRKYSVGLALSIFLVFLTKITANMILPFFSLAFIMYLMAAKKDWKGYAYRYAGWVVLVFIFFHLFRFGLNAFTLREYFKTLFSILFFNTKKSMILSGFFPVLISFLPFMFVFFYEKVLVILLYLSVLFLAMKRKAGFWIFLFAVSHLFLLLMLPVFGDIYQIRYYLPFYFIYSFLIFRAAVLFLREITPDYLRIISALVFLLFLANLVSLSSFPDRKLQAVESVQMPRITQYVNANIFNRLPQGSRIYVEDIRGDCGFYDFVSFIDRADEFYDLADIDPRFGYRLIVNNEEDYEDADYVIFPDCKILDPPGFELADVYNVSGLTDSSVDKIYFMERISEEGST
ncbi:hypothetical protein JXC34_07460 [Candidatus Woesearchaeota archaeon]|nr:hypothetical protein [Candidatus Woesearchaeota archaeon]